MGSRYQLDGPVDLNRYRIINMTGFNLGADSSRQDPYATPVSVSATQLMDEPKTRTPWLRRLIALQAVVIVLALALESYEHETIVGTGQILTLVGLLIAVVAQRNGDRAAMLFGSSAFMFALLIVFLINYNSWLPAQGDRPITILSFAYAAFAVPIAVWLAIRPGVRNGG